MCDSFCLRVGPNKLPRIVITPSSTLYYYARVDRNTRIEIFPKKIAYCTNVHDIQNCIQYAKDHKIPFSMRSGRHSYENYSLSKGLVLDVSNLRDITYDAKTKLVHVGAGLRLIDIYTFLWDEAKVSIPGGSCPTVGIAGITTGGGFGFFGRQHGLLSDNLVELEIVLANGKRAIANDTCNSDLFYACRGAGLGNFGYLQVYI